MQVKFFSDTNFDGFVQSIALLRFDYAVDEVRRLVTVQDPTDTVFDLATDWGGEVIR